MVVDSRLGAWLGQDRHQPPVDPGEKDQTMKIKNVCDAVAGCSTVSQAAEKLGCSRGYIYRVLREHGMSPKALTEGGASVKDCEQD